MGEMNGEEKRSQAKVQRTDQGCDDYAASERDRESRLISSDPQFIGTLRVDRPNRLRGNTARVLLGGIIAQLIDETEDQLGDAHQCIATYQRRIAKLEKRLENMRRLQQLQEDQTN